MTNRLRTLTAKLRSRLSPAAAILRYHRVTDLVSDPHATAVTPAHFDEHLDVVRTAFVPMTLQALVRALRDDLPLRRRAVVVTFDDGYADNLTTARPCLERYDVPATMFVTTGYVDQSRELWWDALERVLLRPGLLPDRLELCIAGAVCTWSLDPNVSYSEEDFERHRGWNWRRGKPPTMRHRLFRELFRKLQPLEEDVRRPIVRQLLAWANAPVDVRSSHRTLTTEEIVRLHASPLVEIGAHSVTHPVFARLSHTRRAEEIRASRAFLEERLGAPVTSFAYPYGNDAGSGPLVATAGFECACTTVADLVFRRQDPYRLPRLYVGDWDGDEFARQLGRWT